MLHYSPRTEQAYVYWIRRFIFHHGVRHPDQMGAEKVGAFLSDLATRGRVSASTQNQALNALVFLYGRVLGRDLGSIENIRTVQELLGHKDVQTTMIYTHVLNRGARSPAHGL
jgi:site-specific recombinase XerC